MQYKYYHGVKMNNKRNKIFYLNSVMPFGKHTGEMIEDLLDDAPGYLVWMYEQDNITFDLEVIRRMEDEKII